MERPILSNLALFVVAMCYLISNTNIIVISHAIESPQYTVVLSDSEFEVRLYKECSWVSALVQGNSSFEQSTKQGFHRLYQYIHGANSNSTTIALSSPVLTTNYNISSSSSTTVHVSEYQVIRLYLSPKYEKSAPQPLAELNLKLEKWESRCMAVRKFSGFADEDDIGKQVESLWSSLKKHMGIVGDGKTTTFQVDNSSYTIAQYNSSRHLSGRLNEVWLNVVSGFSAEGCLLYQP